jgi:hypothetical protein
MEKSVNVSVSNGSNSSSNLNHQQQKLITSASTKYTLTRYPFYHILSVLVLKRFQLIDSKNLLYITSNQLMISILKLLTVDLLL